MKKQTIFIASIFGIMLISSILAMTAFFNLSSRVIDDAPINYHSDVCKVITRADGTVEPMECSHNLLTNAGKNAIRSALTSSDGIAFNYIALCNATASGSCTAADAGDTALDNEFAAGGLERAAGTLLSLPAAGNWSYSKTFTATADNMVTNSTGIFNGSSGQTLLAENTFTTSTLQTNDQITINWSIWVA